MLLLAGRFMPWSLETNEGIGGTELPNEGYSWGTRMSQEVSKWLVNGLIITYL